MSACVALGQEGHQDTDIPSFDCSGDGSDPLSMK
jgi:hypothetical protein